MAKAFQLEIQKHEERDGRTLDHYVPTLFIGLGGTGKDVLMRLRKRFYDEYAAQDREFTRYLIIDTDMERWWPGGDASEEDYAPVRPKVGEHVDCQINEQQFYNTFELLSRQNDESFAGWLKPEMRNYGARSVIKGAGTHRQFGRMAFVLNHRDIRKATENHIKGLLKAAARTDSTRSDAVVEQDTMEVVIVTSMAGGTGAGMFIDVAYMIKDIINEDHHLRALRSKYVTLIAVMPSAFQTVANDPTYRKFQQNGYAALLELEHYGTPRTGDELFMGQAVDPHAMHNRVGFRAPWKMGDQFIEGAGWEACYLIDNVTPLALQTPLSLSETYQMMADYLFLDFQRSEFAVQKRSNRCNLAQFQEDHIKTLVRKTQGENEDTGIHTDSNVVYAHQNGCTFSSFGLAEINFNRDRVYRAAGYRLATHLVRQRWIAHAADLQKGQYESEVKRDIYDPDDNAPSFRPEALTRAVYETDDRGNWFSAARQDLQDVSDKTHFTRGTSALRKLVDKHQKLLGASARQTSLDRERNLSGSASELGPLRQRLRNLARHRANRHGVAVSREFLNHYRSAFQYVSKKAGEIPKSASAAEIVARPAEADTVYFPARKMAQKIEFPRACSKLKAYIDSRYQQAVAPRIRNLAELMRAYIGTKDDEISPELEHHGTLYRYFEESEKQLGRIADQLHLRFDESRTEEGSERTQSLFPTNWDEAKYDDQINRALVSYSQVGAAGKSERFDWEKLNDLVFERIRDNKARELGDIRSLTDLLDHWFDKHQKSEKDIAQVAETLATACRQVLYKAGLNLSAFFEGSVIDLLMIDYSETERKQKMERFIRASAPYLPLDMQSQANMTMGYRPVFDNLLGKKRGDIDNRSASNEGELLEEIDAMSQRVGGDLDGEVNSRLDGEKSALVLCREVWGLPLQYYSPLGAMHAVYMQAGRSVDECHINYNESWEDLPDVRIIDPEIYQHIRDNVENVLFAMIKGTITCRPDGAYIVKVPDKFSGVDTFRVGSRISRIIKKTCEEEAIREHLQRDRAKWGNTATTKEWAIVFASALMTYEFSKREIKKDSDKHSSPLRNCFRMLLEHTQRRLLGFPDGQRWYDHFKSRDPSEDEVGAERYKAVYEDLLERKILFRSSPYVPIYEIGWKALESYELPGGEPSDAPAEPSQD